MHQIWELQPFNKGDIYGKSEPCENIFIVSISDKELQVRSTYVPLVLAGKEAVTGDLLLVSKMNPFV